MTIRKYSSTSQETTLISALSSSASSMVVGSSSALLGSITLANTTPKETFIVVIDPDTALEEIVEVIYPSSVESNTLTIVRNIDGSSGIAHSAGAKIRHMAIGRDFREANTHINGNLTEHASTTSAQLASVISDETGTGSLVFNSSPTIVTPTIASFVNAPHNHLNGTGGGTITSAAVSDFTESVEDVVGAMVSGNTESGISVTYDDATGKYNFNVNDPVITIAGDVTGSATITNLGDTTITVAIPAGTVVNADISDTAAIAKTKISGTAITAADSGTVTSAMIADGTIVNADINAAAGIAATKVAGTAVTQADTGTITSTMIADGTIVNADINAGAAISKTKLDLGGTITSADLVDGTIVAADIADATITPAKFSVDPYARANHTGTQTASTISNFDTQVRTNRLDQMTAPTAAVSMNSQKITGLALANSDGDAVSVDWINSQKGVANGIAPLDTNGKVPLDHIPATAIAEVFVVSSEAQMLAISGVGVGDIAIRSDLNKSFILRATPGTTLSNWNELLTPIDSVLSVDGQTGAVSLSSTYLNRTTGQLLGNLDANTFTVTNLGTPTNANDAATKTYVDTVAGSATAAAASAAAAATTYDNFDDRYLGSKSVAPTVDNDGNTLLVGAIYWNSSTNAMYAWTGTEWGSISSTADIYRFRFTATGGETTISGLDDNGLTLSYLPGKEQVYLNGVLLARTSDYTATSGNSLTSLGALAAGDIVEVITFTAFELVDSIARAILDNKGDIIVATSADTPSKLAVGTNGHYLKANSSTVTGLEWAEVPNPDLTPYATNVSVQNNLIMSLMGAI